MIKTQIQFPDGLYARLKKLASEQEWSLAETMRRGAELLLATRPIAPRSPRTAWVLDPPANTRLLTDPFADPDWREAANQSSSAAALLKGKAKR